MQPLLPDIITIEAMKTHTSKKFKLSVTAALVLAALGGYFTAVHYSEPAQPDLMSEFLATRSTTPAPAEQPTTADLAPVEVMLVGLKQRLERQPDDVQGWVLLSKSYYHLNRLQEAKESFDRAVALGYAGDWQPLPRIDALPGTESISQSFGYSHGVDNDGIGQNRGSEYNPAGAMASNRLRLKVSLDPSLRPQLEPESSVYIFVRAVENPGPPLAVVRKKVAELPLEITLSDSHAMMPNLKLSDAENVVVGARISPSGNPERRQGDYEQLSDSIPSNFAETVELVISNPI